MRFVSRKTLGVCVLTSVCLVAALGCDDQAAQRAAQQAEARYWQKQEEIMERQNAEWDQQLERAEAQEKRYNALLSKWEHQAQRVDGLLDRWEVVLGTLEERSTD